MQPSKLLESLEPGNQSPVDGASAEVHTPTGEIRSARCAAIYRCTPEASHESTRSFPERVGRTFGAGRAFYGRENTPRFHL
jgi:hypothetical protein